jgi:hypothetical protein
MFRVRLHAREAHKSVTILETPFSLRRLFGTVVAAVLAIGSSAAVATADVGTTGRFTPSSWQTTGVTTTTSVTRTTPGRSTETRRSRRAVSTSTDIDDFDVPSRPARRATSTRRASRVTTTTARQRQPRRVRVAALTSTDFQTYEVPTTRTTPRRNRSASTGRIGLPSIRALRPSLTGGGIAWRANAGCLASNLRSIVASLASSFGSVTVNSTCRSRSHNRRVGGASRSWHLTGNAVDFRVHGGNLARVSAYLRANVGGFKHYGGGRYHIDNGPRRSF